MYRYMAYSLLLSRTNHPKSPPGTMGPTLVPLGLVGQDLMCHPGPPNGLNPNEPLGLS